MVNKVFKHRLLCAMTVSNIKNHFAMYLFRWKYMGIIHIQTALACQVSVVVFAVSKQSCAENKKAKDSWQRSRLLLSTNLNWVQHRNSYRRPHISHQKLWLWFLTPQGQPRSNLTMPIESPRMGSNLVSVTVCKIFRIKELWPWPLTSQGSSKVKPMGPTS